MAISKLEPRTKPIKVSLIVIRISQKSTVLSYTLNNSRPCASCISKFKNVKGYKIRKIYSNVSGKITCEKLRDLILQPQHISKYYKYSNTPKYISAQFIFETKSSKLSKLSLD